MKYTAPQSDKKANQEAMLSPQRVKEIMQEEGIEYTEEELQEVIDTISKWIVISADHYSRIKQKTKIISLNSNPTHETKSIPIHSRKYGRTG